MKKRIIAVFLSVSLIFSVLCFSASAADTANYTVNNPYSSVNWETWGAYKGSLHSHSTYSDASVDLATMVKGYYDLGFDFLANSDHSVTGVAWNEEPARLALYSYQPLVGCTVAHLTDDEYTAITNGTYNNRGKKMVCVVGANELNNLSITKNHVNGYFLPSNVGNGFAGVENELGFEKAIKFIDKNGGLSHINHPGDWLASESDDTAVSSPYNVNFFGNLLLKYDSCLGIEVFNEGNSKTPHDRILWDNLLMHCLPYGKDVIGFSNTDAHDLFNINSSFSVFMMEENNVENIKKTMQSGAFFAITRVLDGNNLEIGPKESFNARSGNVAYPMFTNIRVDGHKISVNAADAKEIQWVANGHVIMKQAIGSDEVTLDLDSIEGSEDFLYVRAELTGDGGMCLSQAFVIDDGSEPLEFNENDASPNFFDSILLLLKSTKCWAIGQRIANKIRAS